ncbi:hypothetical protein JB92DRAFT_2853701 [Gautieria morchelliformis]|nr:hypothetical protein JB92DRAFT_2853701 [Gautieria morchelliformis]
MQTTGGASRCGCIFVFETTLTPHRVIVEPSTMSAAAAVQVKKDKAVSCAECRRLKLKCDRNFPCSSCRKRGLSALCPNVALPTRPRKQPTDGGKPSMTEMTSRIRELEEALRSLHAIHSNQPHPLLVDHDFTHEHAPPAGIVSDRPESPVEGDLDRLEESLGTLTIDHQSGKFSFFGQSAGMESLYHTELREESDPEQPDVQAEWSSEPFDPLRVFALDSLYPRLPSEVIMRHLEGHLPDPLRAWALCDLFYTNAAWMYCPVSLPQFQDNILVPVYSTAPPSLTDSSLTHVDVSILFMVFAIASSLDLSGPTDTGNNDPHTASQQKANSDPDRYHHFARAALTAGVSLIEEPSISGVRSVFLMAYYHMLRDREQAPQTVWSLTSIAVGLAVSIGLHRDSERWKLDQTVVQQRRRLFWELNVFMGFMGLAFGRPPQITLPFIDCEVGPDTEQSITADGEIVHGHSYRLHTITSTILSEIRDFVLSTKQNYKDTLALDRKLRDSAMELFGTPIGCRQVGPEVLKGPDTVATMQNFFLLALKESMVVALHRKYFVRACSCRPEDLATSRHYPSFLATFRSARVIIDIMSSLLSLEPILPCRFWFFWSHTLATAIIVGSVAIRHPRSVLVVEAMNALENVLELFHRCANQTDRVDRPTRALKIVTKLRERARLAISQPDYNVQADVHRQDDELKVLGGHARVVSTRHAGSATTQSTPPMDSPQTTDVHPSLMEDLTVVRQQDQDARSAREGSHSTSPDVPPRQSTIELFSGVNVPQSYAPAGPVTQFENLEGSHTVGDASHLERLHPSGGAFGMSVTAMDDFGNVFAMAPNIAQEWGDTYYDRSWQGFVADLGVSGGGLG